jgi:FtsH-binding integral membrane protein
MTETLSYQRMGTAARGQAHALFAQTMAYVAATAALFALGAWLGRDLTGGVGIIAFIAGFGAAGYATRRDLTALARVLFWALLALIVFGIVLIFVNIPGGALVYSVLGLVIFAGFTMFDFQRLRTSTDIASAPFLAASIFLDILNVFLFFLQIFSGQREN